MYTAKFILEHKGFDSEIEGIKWLSDIINTLEYNDMIPEELLEKPKTKTGDFKISWSITDDTKPTKRKRR